MARHQQRCLTAIALALGTVLSMGACATTVTAEGLPNVSAPPVAPRPAEAPRVDLMSKFDLDPDAASEHWQERGSDHITPDPGEVDPDDQAPNDEATGLSADPTDGLGPISLADGVGLGDQGYGDPAPQDGMNYGTTGRLYFTHDEDWSTISVCSATVVTSATRDVIATAGHCVWDSDIGSVYLKLLFVPGDLDNAAEAPWGVFAASEVFLRTEFQEQAFSDPDLGLSGEGWAYDYAFIRLAPNNEGVKVQDAVGAQGIAFGIPAETLVVIGYPTAEPFDGTSERYCAATSWSRYRMGGYSIECSMTPGCSGGGWFARWDPERGAGYLVGVSSTSNGFDLNANALGAAAYELFEYAGALDESLFSGGGIE
ncbi:MAG: hypothetical protein LBE08_08905 [Bifidobacteriaceae bacterium]|jgi:V8-like Glu-specific endopeptidase|nr:hypothetical protein [Bifidobacteriaceae bacterium]